MYKNDLLNDIYLYDNPIGHGSFSIIHKGFSYKINNTVAVKQITKSVDIRHFNNEISLMKNISHPNVLKLYYTFQSLNSTYLVLELCDGGDLSYYINTKINDFDSKYFTEILEGLKYLYSNKILHRDIKPQNILIKNYSIKISDFGLAKSFEKTKLLSTFCGSPLYMAPEIIKNKNYNEISDIWSLGVVLYELVTKIHPYTCDDKETLWSKAISGNFEINFNIIPEQYSSLIKKLLVYDYLDRISWDDLYIYDINIKEKYGIKNRYNKPTPSILIPNTNTRKDTSSIQIPNLNTRKDTTILEEDYRIFSKSEPKDITSSYFENYMTKKEINEEDTNIPILGSSPSSTKPLNNILNKSIGTIKNFFN